VDGTVVDTSASNPLPVVQTGTPGLPTGAATAANQSSELTLEGAVNETAPASDTASSGLNGRLQRIAQRLTSVIALLPTALGAGGGLKVDGSGTALPVSGTVAVTNADITTIAGAIKAEDAASANADPGMVVHARRTDTPANTATTDGDYQPLQSVGGRLAASATIDAALPAGGNNIGDVDVLTLPALPAGTNAIGKLAANSGVDIGDVDVTTVGTITPGTAATSLGKAEDGAHTSGDVGVFALGVRANTPAPTGGTDGDYTAPLQGASGGMWSSEVADPAGGTDVFKSLDLDETEEDVKTSAGSVYGALMFNRATTPRYVKFYNATAANVTVGSTTPVMTVPIPEAASGGAAGVVFAFAPGIKFTTAICVAATTGVADADTGAPAANDVVVNVFYK
jgi:hypothetical protein